MGIDNKSINNSIKRILTLDGGGAKGFYTLGVLSEIEGLTGKALCESFDLIFGTSTGSIIAALLAQGEKLDDIRSIYEQNVPSIMRARNYTDRTRSLHKSIKNIFRDQNCDVFKTKIGIVATNWNDERPIIFKNSISQAHGSTGSFQPFFGCSIADAVIASCSAYPFFKRYKVKKGNGDILELADGGFCANNPTLYAIADATLALEWPKEMLRVVSLGVGSYPQQSFWKRIGRVIANWPLMRHIPNSDFLQKILGTNTNSMDVLRNILFKNVPTVRISETFSEPALATDLLEDDLTKLNRLAQKGRLSFSKEEERLKSFLIEAKNDNS